MSQLFCFRALKLGLEAVARRLWCLRAIKSEFFCFFQNRILFCLNRKTLHKAKCEWYAQSCRELVQRCRRQVQDASGVLKLGGPMANQRSSANWVIVSKNDQVSQLFPRRRGIVWLPIYRTACYQFPCNVILRFVFFLRHKQRSDTENERWVCFSGALAQAKSVA